MEPARSAWPRETIDLEATGAREDAMQADPATDTSRPNRALLRQATWRRWTATSAASRLPVAMAPLSLLFLGHGATGSYGVGSVMASAFTFAEALAAPGCGRLLSRHPDVRRGLAVSLAGGVAVIAGLALAGQLRAPTAILIVLSAAAGAVPSGVQGGLRALLQRVVPEGLRESAYLLDSTLLEVEWMAAPALVALVMLFGAPPLAVAVMAVAALVALLMLRTLPALAPTDGSDEEDHPAAGASPWRAPAALGAYLASLVLGYAEGTINLALAPLLDHIGSAAGDAGFVLSGLSAASAVGGFGYGWINRHLWPAGPARAAVLLTGLGLLVVPVALANSLLVVVVAVAVFGLLVAPINAVRSYQLSQALPEDRQPEGFSILYGANGVGFGISGLVSAALLHAEGPRNVIILAGVITAAIGAASGVVTIARSR
jgi:predicted MFS family arabinose efflux permease